MNYPTTAKLLEMFHSDYDSPLYRPLRAHVPQICPWQGANGQT